MDLNTSIYNLPPEILSEITLYIPLTYFNRLRCVSKVFREYLDVVPTLYFQAYVDSVEMLVHKNIQFNSNRRIKLHISSVDDRALRYLVEQNHVHEFIRSLQPWKSHLTSKLAKQDAFITIIKNNGDPQMIRVLLENFDVDPCQYVIYNTKRTTSVYVGQLIHWASEHGHQDLIAYLLEDPRIDVRAKDNFHDEAIHIMASCGHLDSLKLALNCHKINPNSLGHKKQLITHAAAYGGHPEIIKFILESCIVDPNITDEYGHNIIHIAAEEGFADIIDVITNYALSSKRKNNVKYASFNMLDFEGEGPIVNSLFNF